MHFLIPLILGILIGGGVGIQYEKGQQADILGSKQELSYFEENTPDKKYHFTEEEFILVKGEAFAEGAEKTKQRCESGDVETQYTKQQCLSYGYSPTRLHTCPNQKTADDFQYLCNNRHSDGYAQCLRDFSMEFSWLFEGDNPLVKNSLLKQKIDALEASSKKVTENTSAEEALENESNESMKE